MHRITTPSSPCVVWPSKAAEVRSRQAAFCWLPSGKSLFQGLAVVDLRAQLLPAADMPAAWRERVLLYRHHTIPYQHGPAEIASAVSRATGQSAGDSCCCCCCCRPERQNRRGGKMRYIH